MYDLMALAIMLMILVFLLSILGPLTALRNLWTLLRKRECSKRAEMMSFVLGSLYMVTLYVLFWNPRPWEESIVHPSDLASLHEPLSREHILTVIVLLLAGMAAYLFLKRAGKQTPPLAKVLAMAGVYTGIVINLLLIIQLCGVVADNGLFMNFLPFDVFLMILVPLNYIALAVALLLKTIRIQSSELAVKEQAEAEEPYKNRFLNDCNNILARSRHWAFYALLLTLPLLCVITVVLLLFGQRPDSAIRAFTETSDWTLSTKISPPDLTTGMHYLCTVALRGHEKLVRPTRMGPRRGERIVVNRQLCVANAFEQLLEERTPRFHRAVRKFYDTYGYPISRHIRTPLAADIVYLIMKPLEWLFVAVLYLFDEKPENRIALQYLPYDHVRDGI